jgi:conjugal transfer pilus assembly protein TraV
MKPFNPVLLLLPLSLLSGCKALVPYDSEFACAKSHDYGQCMDVHSAYEDARANEGMPVPGRPGATFKPGVRAPTSRQSPDNMPAEQRGNLLRELYDPADHATRLREARYREIAGLIENPVTPLVQAPKVLRTLIVSYSAGDTLYMPRFVYYIAEDAQFVLGDYLEAAPVERTVYPNGAPAQWSAVP